ncbi:MAG: hypothetical protein ACYTHM_03750 [Planctomycetota bacterium]|jgi:hypothetical protein
MNKEQWVLIASVLLLGLGVYLSLNGWIPEKEFQPPAAQRTKPSATAEAFAPPLFSTEDDEGVFRTGGRDPFQPNRETEPLPLATLETPPLPTLKRIAPGTAPGLGSSNLRTLEENIPEGKIDMKASGTTEEEEEEEDEGGWERRRY